MIASEPAVHGGAPMCSRGVQGRVSFSSLLPLRSGYRSVTLGKICRVHLVPSTITAVVTVALKTLTVYCVLCS